MSFLNENENENELVMESIVSCETKVGEKVNKALTEKKVSKTLTMNEKRAMYGILSFLVIVNRDGLLDDAKTQELMEHLPIFGTVAEKKLYLSQEMFDMKQIETDILKPMVLEHNQRKKEEKKKGKVKKSEGEVKEKKKRVYKKKEEVKEGEEVEVKEKKKRVYKKKEEVKEEVKEEGEVEEEGEVKEEEVKEKKKRVYKKKEEVKEEVKEVVEVKEKKRGRKAKEQIVECKVDVNVNEGNSQEDQLAELVNQLTDSNFELANPKDIDVEDLDDLLSDMQEKKLPETPRLPEPEPEPVTKEKAQKKKTSKKNKE